MQKLNLFAYGPIVPEETIDRLAKFCQAPVEEMNATFVTIKVSAVRASMSRWHLAGQCVGPVGGFV